MLQYVKIIFRKGSGIYLPIIWTHKELLLLSEFLYCEVGPHITYWIELILDQQTDALTGNSIEMLKYGSLCILHEYLFCDQEAWLEDDFMPKNNFTASQEEMIKILKQWEKIINTTPTISMFYITRDIQGKILFAESISKEIYSNNLENLNLKLLQNFFDYFQQFDPDLFDDFLYDSNQNNIETGMHRITKEAGNLIISRKSGDEYCKIPILLFIDAMSKFWEFNQQNNFPEKFNMLYTDTGKIEFYLNQS